MDSLRGRLLVATPAIDVGPFRRSVVLVLDHDEDGALGVILNHPLEADVEDVLPDWAAVVDAPDCLFEGGPVATDAALAVGVRASSGPGVDAPPEGWRPMTGRVGLVDLDGPLPREGALRGLRVFAGYAGWGPGQLESEREEGSWLVVEARDDDLLSPVPERLWREVLLRQGDDVRFWATFPEEPAHN
jgi:putative transcriptional regulator